MRIEVTKQECRWLSDLAKKAKAEAENAHEATPHPLLALRAENMAALEAKLDKAMQRHIQRERSGAR
jgi:predicted ATPase